MQTIYAIPGLGTTKELLKYITVPNFNLKVLDWPTPQPGLTLKEYASKFVSAIDTTKPVYLLGVSFGGMLCMEIASQVTARKVILISSCKSGSEIPPQIRALKYMPLFKLFTDSALRAVAKKSRRILGFKKDFDQQFYKMVDSMSKNYFVYCIEYIIGWKSEFKEVPLLHIHGTSDKVLPHTYIKNFVKIDKGSHAMVLYEHEKINSLLDKELNGL